jgi:hypothetical protein
MWNPHFGEDDHAFDSVRAAAERLRHFSRWPTVEELDRALTDLVPVRFVLQPPKRRRRRGPIDPTALYDGSISVRREVPTRAESWHDLLNALVWASFPKSKTALHARLHRAMCARISAHDLRLPNARTKEQDLLAMIDEGGVLIAGDRRLVFGHAILEHRIVAPDMPIRPCELALEDATDAALAGWLETGTMT